MVYIYCITETLHATVQEGQDSVGSELRGKTTRLLHTGFFHHSRVFMAMALPEVSPA